MNQEKPSYEHSKNRFDGYEAAAKYNTKNRGTRKDRLEKACIGNALSGLPKGSHVLDLPCGTGRVTHFLFEKGFSVTAADYSEHMVKFAEENFSGMGGVGTSNLKVAFEQQDVMNISHPDKAFDAVLCNRLFHHYYDSESRQQALKEISRVSRGPIVVSFFSTGNIATLRGAIKRTLKGDTSKGRIPIPLATFEEDLRASGLQIDGVYYAQRYISSQTYIKARRI